MKSPEFSADQLNLIADLIACEKFQISGDISEENSELSPASLSVLTIRFWRLQAIHELLNVNKTTTINP